MKDEVKESSWQKMAVPLQIQFGQKAEEMLGRYEKKLTDMESSLAAAKRLLSIQDMPKDSSWKNWKIVAVDGSNTEHCEKNGMTMACVSATAIEIDMSKEAITWEDYAVGVVVDDGSFESGRFEFDDLIALKRMELERMMAAKAANEMSPNLLIMDGPFFPTNKVIELGDSIEESLGEIASSTISASAVPMIGLVKRSNSIFLHAKSHIENRGIPKISDKLIATMSLNPLQYCLLGRTLEIRKASYRVAASGIKSDGVAHKFITDRWKPLGEKFIDKFNSDTYMVRTHDSADSFKLEIPGYCAGMKDAILSFLAGWSNPDTGLPFALDLVDSMSAVPADFSQEFSAEVEAGLYDKIKDPAKLKFISKFFAALNPQEIYK